VPVVDINARKVIHIGQWYKALVQSPLLIQTLDFPPSYQKTKNGPMLSTPNQTVPPPLDADPLKAAYRERIPPPLKPFDFLPDLMAKSEEGGHHPRTDLKPLHVVQPEGVSFKMDGHVLEWQNWKMHIGKLGNGVEGIARRLTVYLFSFHTSRRDSSLNYYLQ
jgi:primary-amine oxidase